MIGVDAVARMCYEALGCYVYLSEDKLQVAWQQVPDWQKQMIQAGVVHVLAGYEALIHVSAWESHDVWMQTMQAAGWTYGEVRDPEKKTHPLLLPFEKLPNEDKLKDYLFVGIVEACYRAGVRREPDRNQSGTGTAAAAR